MRRSPTYIIATYTAFLMPFSVSLWTYAKLSQQGVATKTVLQYGQALQRSWGGFSYVRLEPVYDLQRAKIGNRFLEAIAYAYTDQPRINFHGTDFSTTDRHIAAYLHFFDIQVQRPVFIEFEIYASLYRQTIAVALQAACTFEQIHIRDAGVIDTSTNIRTDL
ncbi:UNKNOWN [Stylonychia lemnae]|uniref:Uncharacterized protein n=1 Tax=Stylonychia lemnae TaxID=5949 RepID=A0A078AMW7_STYLE|nr:UNKNOWN [Stylonychia lemnae]|eukprot:CDW82228.1 UNKNOWN [Stylonychia lemnae]